MHLHHATLFAGDADRSLAFYGDGLGLTVFVDREYEGDWPGLFGVTSSRLRAIIMGDPANPQLGQVELLTMAEPVSEGLPAATPVTGTIVLSFLVDIAAVLPRLEAAGGTDVRRSVLLNGHAVATVRDPDGVIVELVDALPIDAATKPAQS